MCVTTGLKRFTYSPGDNLFIKGTEYVVLNTDMRYMDTNGDPNKLYCSLHGKEDSSRWIVTHDKLLELVAKPMRIYSLTPDQILEVGPCDDGLRFLVDFLRGIGSSRGLSRYQMLREIVRSNKLNNTFSLQALYSGYLDIYSGVAPPTSWLMWVAKMLKVIPQQSNETKNYDTLKRLLGIK